jgi:hypothetical protein
MSGPRLIRDVFALASMLVVLKSIPRCCYTILQRGISAIVGENGLGMLHVNFLIAVVGLRAILEMVTCCMPHRNTGTLHGYLHESKHKFKSFSCAI